MKKSAIFAIFMTVALFSGLFGASGVLAVCPNNTTVTGTTANLVGQVTDDGGDPNLTVWFQYGTTPSFGSETPQQSQNGIGSFCANVSNLIPGNTYSYRAVVRNSAATSFGNIQSFFIQPLPVTVNLTVNNSDVPAPVNGRSAVVLTWTSTNAASCQASGDWTTAQAAQGSAQGSVSLILNQIKTHTFTLTCSNANNSQTGQDSVSIVVRAVAPTVITLPAIVTL